MHKLPPKYLPIVIILRASGWRIGDVLNLRYDTCLECSASGWWLKGDILKTNVINHKVPLSEEVAAIVRAQCALIKNTFSEQEIEWEHIRHNLDAVRLPNGYCFKPKKANCPTQDTPCYTCRHFCTTPDFLPQFEHEEQEMRELIELGKKAGSDRSKQARWSCRSGPHVPFSARREEVPMAVLACSPSAAAPRPRPLPVRAELHAPPCVKARPCGCSVRSAALTQGWYTE